MELYFQLARINEDASDPLAVPAKPFDIAQVQDAQAKAPVAVGRGQPDQPIGDPGVLLADVGLITEACLADREGLTRMPDARMSIRDR